MDMSQEVVVKIIITVIALVAFVLIPILTLRIEFIETNAEEFSFYLDGVEVEYDNTSLEQYDIDYDLDSKKVFLTKRAGGSSSTLFPVFLPGL